MGIPPKLKRKGSWLEFSVKQWSEVNKDERKSKGARVNCKKVREL